jgi:hypothetical protein
VERELVPFGGEDQAVNSARGFDLYQTFVLEDPQDFSNVAGGDLGVAKEPLVVAVFGIDLGEDEEHFGPAG